MVSNLHSASAFYNMQKKKEIAKGLNPCKKLQKDNKGFYLMKRKTNGEAYKQRISKSDMVYSRGEGVTKYSIEKDRNRRTRAVKETYGEHSKHPFDGDRETIKGYKYRV